MSEYIKNHQFHSQTPPTEKQVRDSIDLVAAIAQFESTVSSLVVVAVEVEAEGEGGDEGAADSKFLDTELEVVWLNRVGFW